jgi:hypothetical protein
MYAAVARLQAIGGQDRLISRHRDSIACRPHDGAVDEGPPKRFMPERALSVTTVRLPIPDPLIHIELDMEKGAPHACHP